MISEPEFWKNLPPRSRRVGRARVAAVNAYLVATAGEGPLTSIGGEVSRAHGVSPATLYRWLQLVRAGDWRALSRYLGQRGPGKRKGENVHKEQIG
jgi:hypothetical protein